MADQTEAAPAKEELDFHHVAAKGWTWTWQRCGRYKYRKCSTYLTNPDHLVSQPASLTSVSRLRIAARYTTRRR